MYFVNIHYLNEYRKENVDMTLFLLFSSLAEAEFRMLPVTRR